MHPSIFRVPDAVNLSTIAHAVDIGHHFHEVTATVARLQHTQNARDGSVGSSHPEVVSKV